MYHIAWTLDNRPGFEDFDTTPYSRTEAENICDMQNRQENGITYRVVKGSNCFLDKAKNILNDAEKHSKG